MVRTPGEDKAPSSDQKPFSTSTTRTNQGRKRWPPGSILHCPARYGSPKISDLSFHITYYRVVVVDSWSSCRIQYTLSARSNSPAVGGNLVPKKQNGVRGASGTRGGQGSKILPYIYSSRKPGTKPVIPGSMPRTVWKPQPLWLIADWPGLVDPAPRRGYGPIPGSAIRTSTTPIKRGRKR